jgi:hypothetical protein
MTRLLLFLLTISITVFSQTGPGTWQDHLGLSSCNSVTKLGTRIYASYGNGITYFEESEVSPRVINKINGLSDVGVRLVRANAYNNKVLVIYNNCNMDVVDVNGNIQNYPDFSLKSLNGRKVVNEVYFDKNIAYLACGFGIVVFDMEKLEIQSTLYIGPKGADVNVLQVALNDTHIFAASPQGVYVAARAGNLSNYKSWSVDSVKVPKGYYVGVINVQGRILTAYTPSQPDFITRNADTIYEFKNGSWEKYGPLAGVGHTIRKMGATYQNYFHVFDMVGMLVRDVNTGDLRLFSGTFNGETDYLTMRDGLYAKDHTGNLSFWLADRRFGLYQTYGYYPYDKQNKVNLNGVHSNYVSNIDVFDGLVAVSPSNIEVEGVGNHITEGVSILNENEWRYLEVTGLDQVPLQDITGVLIDRKDKSLWITSWYYGLLHYVNNKLVRAYTTFNSPMPDIGLSEPRAAGMSMDEAGNLWFSNSDLKGNLSVERRDGSYINYELQSGPFTKKTMVDKNNFVWVLHQREGGLTVFNHNNFGNAVYRTLNKDVGNGNLESNSVHSIAEDKDGKIWVGTEAGIRVFYNPSSIFGNGDIDAQPIKIVQDGNVELLLEKEIVSAIAVDGANNKWVGTSAGGVYCFTPDGITQIHHFTKENSPLYSNAIIDLNYDEITGNVFIGTEYGVQSYHSTIIAGAEDYEKVFAYPNPVRPGYQGTVLVRGLVDNSVVKITDESGNLVWETKSTGGQISWPVKTLSGTRVSTGVYLVYATTTDGELRSLTKVLVVN